MVSKHKSTYVGNLEMAKRSHEVLSLSEEMKIINLMRKEENCILRPPRSTTGINHSMKFEEGKRHLCYS